MGNQQSGKAAIVIGGIGVVLAFVPVINNLAFILGIIAVTLALFGIIKKVDKKRIIIGFVLGLLAIVITLTIQGIAFKKMKAEENKASTGIEIVIDTYRV